MAADFSKLDSIFRMVTPADYLIAQKIGIGDPAKENSLSRLLQKLLLEYSNGGISNSAMIHSKLNEYRTSASANPDGTVVGDKKDFDSIVNFYSLKSGPIPDVKYPYMYLDGKAKEASDNIAFEQISGLKKSDFGERDMSITVVNSPFVSPLVRDAQKVELFLNFLPSIVLSRCVPYLELEFAFDRGFDKETEKRLTTAGMLKFLLGGVEVADGTPDSVMFKSRAWADGDNAKSSAGMEMFTSPQTLVNMNPIKEGSRYVDVLDPTRPFASLESVAINVAPTKGIMSFKKATAVIKLHDRSRLSELADLIQPTTYTRTTVWLTYGWRHPFEPSADKSAETYADFINNNMLTKEAYGVKNAGFSFDAVGQVTITLELFTKSVSELRDMKISDDKDSFKSITRDIEALAREIGDLRKKYKLDPPGLTKEIRGYMILDAAESGQFPTDLDPKQIKESIATLRKSLEAAGRIEKGHVDPLIKALEQLYAPEGGKGKENKFKFKEAATNQAKAISYEKFRSLSNGYDPFLIFKEKNEKMKSETGNDDHPLLKHIEAYNTQKDSVSEELIKELKEKNLSKTVCSFGKLFSVFMTNALIQLPAIDEFQIMFYMLNDRCGPASCTNIAEFPIDVPVFMRQYKEVIEANGTEAMAVEEFVKLAVDAQLNDPRAIPYGFRTAGVFKPWNSKEKDPTTKDKKTGEQYESMLSSINGKRGTFQMPQIEVHIESTHEKFKGTDAVDLLQYYEQPGKRPSTNPSSKDQQSAGFSNLKKIVRIHIYDKTANPYKTAAQILRHDSSSGTSYVEIDPDPWVKKKTENTVQVLQNVMKDVMKVISSTGNTGIQLTNMRIEPDVNNQQVKNMVSKMVPSIIYGMNASAVLEATISSKQDAKLTAAQLLGLNSGRKVIATPAGGGQGGLPLKVIPAALTIRTIGCPLLNYSQLFFCDFNTGTTIDNIYGISGLNHNFSPGKFESSLTMAFYDAYGKYEAAPSVIGNLKSLITGLDKLTCSLAYTSCIVYKCLNHFALMRV